MRSGSGALAWWRERQREPTGWACYCIRPIASRPWSRSRTSAGPCRRFERCTPAACSRCWAGVGRRPLGTRSPDSPVWRRRPPCAGGGRRPSPPGASRPWRATSTSTCTSALPRWTTGTADELHSRARQVSVSGHAFRVFAPEDHLRLLCLHFLKHGGWRPLWLCDVAALVEAEASALDWAYFATGDERRVDAAARVLTLAEELLGAQLDAVPRDLACRRPPRWMVRPGGAGPGATRPSSPRLPPAAGTSSRRSRDPEGALPALANGVEATAARGALVRRPAAASAAARRVPRAGGGLRGPSRDPTGV